MQGKSSHSIKLDNVIFEIYFSQTNTCDNIWNENIMLIEGKIDSAYNEIVYWKKVFSCYQLEQQGRDSLKK